MWCGIMISFALIRKEGRMDGWMLGRELGRKEGVGENEVSLSVKR